MFPWDPAPSWQCIQELLKTECSIFMRTWEFNPEVDSSPYQKLFKVFTWDLWLSIGSHIIDANKLPNPRSLGEAMCAWTPHAIETTLGKDWCHFFPSAHGWMWVYKRIPSPIHILVHTSISTIRIMISCVLQTIWIRSFQIYTAYLLANPQTRGTIIWSTVKSKIQFVTNSSFYRIQEVGGRINDNGAPIHPQTLS